jgi:hypothetical protein
MEMLYNDAEATGALNFGTAQNDWLLGHYPNVVAYLAFSTPYSTVGWYPSPYYGFVRFVNGILLNNPLNNGSQAPPGIVDTTAAPGPANSNKQYPLGEWFLNANPASAAYAAAWVQTTSEYSVSATGNTTLGSTSVTSLNSAGVNGCGPGDFIVSSGNLNPGTTISSVNQGNSSLTLSQNAIATTSSATLTCQRFPRFHTTTTSCTFTSSSASVSCSGPADWVVGDKMVNSSYIPTSGTYALTVSSGLPTSMSQAASASGSGNVTDAASQIVPLLDSNGYLHAGSVLPQIQVGNLPACSSSLAGLMLAVTNNNAACSYGGTPTASGSYNCPVYCNGSAWTIH